MDGTTTMQGTEQEVQNTATETQGQQTAESTPEKVSTLQKFIDGLFGGGKKAEGAEPEKKDGDPVAEKAEEEKSFTQADVDAAIEAAKQQWLYHREVLLMQITGANDVDIMLDEDGQPVSDGNGDTALVSDDECWLQDIKNEAMTEEGELFYEDEEGDASYGWSLLDFMQGEYDDFTQMEIQQRIRSKMSKRDYIDAGSIQTTVNFDGHIYHIRIAFRRTDSNSEYNIDIESNGVEVIVE